MTNPYILLALVGAWIASVTGTYLYGGHVQKAEDIAAQDKAIRADQTHYEAILAQQEKTAYESSDAYQKELLRLRAQPEPIPTVRVCVSTQPARQVPRTSVPAGGSGPAAPSGGVLPPEPGPDIGLDLYALADRADALSAQLRGCQAFIEGLR